MLKRFIPEKEWFLTNEFFSLLGITFLVRLRLSHIITVGCTNILETDGIRKCTQFTNDLARSISYTLDIVFLFILVSSVFFLSKLILKVLITLPSSIKYLQISALGIVVWKWWKFSTVNSALPHIYNIGFIFQVRENTYRILLAIVSLVAIYAAYKIRTQNKKEIKYTKLLFITIGALLSLWIYTIRA